MFLALCGKDSCHHDFLFCGGYYKGANKYQLVLNKPSQELVKVLYIMFEVIAVES